MEELKGLKSRLADGKTAREVIAPALLLMQAERLGVDETPLRYFVATVSGAIGGDGYVPVAMKRVELASNKRAVALLWAVALAAHGIKAEVRRTRSGFQVIVSGDNAVNWLAYTSSTGTPCLKETIGLRATSWLKPWSWGSPQRQLGGAEED